MRLHLKKISKETKTSGQCKDTKVGGVPSVFEEWTKKRQEVKSKR